MTFSSSSETKRTPSPKPIPDGSSEGKRAPRRGREGSSNDTSHKLRSPAKHPASSTSESTITRLLPTLTTPTGRLPEASSHPSRRPEPARQGCPPLQQRELLSARRSATTGWPTTL